MLIEIKAHTGIEFVNPEQITTVSMMRGYALIHLTNQQMIPIDLEEWARIQPTIALPTSQLEERYTQALHTIYRLSQSVRDLEAQLNPEQSPNDFDVPDYDGLPF
jgi:hypothetical protein